MKTDTHFLIIYIYMYLNSSDNGAVLIYRVAQNERMIFISACDFFLWSYLKSKV